jgi:hypothetical protein
MANLVDTVDIKTAAMLVIPFQLNFSYDEPLEGRYRLTITADHNEVGIYSALSNDRFKSVSDTTGVFLWKDNSDSE